MNSGSIEIQLTWQEPATGQRREPRLRTPIAFGREFARMPTKHNGHPVARMVLSHDQVSRFHALLEWEQNQQLVVTDQGSVNGIYVNGQRQTRAILNNGDILQIGPYAITVNFANPNIPISSSSPSPAASSNSTIQFNPHTNSPDPTLSPHQPFTPLGSNFPPSVFQQQQVPVQALHATGLSVDEIDYLAVGAGLGSFVWVDLLRISGVPSDKIIAVGVDKQPYARYKLLCQNSQIPSHERLRSNSDSCPDNIWGWPSYAWREAWHDLMQGKLSNACRYLWQVFAEPTFAETYTPRSGNVFDSIDREARRIGWDKMYRFGRVLAIRKTNDGRYCVAISRGSGDRGFFVCRYLHLATGYPALQFLPHLQAYREKYKDFKSVVNAYEEHNHVYAQLERQGGKVLIQGRGIVASRIIQRLYEARQKNSDILILHLMRSPKPQGNKYGRAQRPVRHHVELQPFNWPKACWGGQLREILEKANPQERKELISNKVWGGTTTADRRDWQNIIENGIAQGWYKIQFAVVTRVEQNANQHLITYIQDKDFGEIQLPAVDFIIDATGLDAKVKESPLLADLIEHYNLPLNPIQRLSVANDFEIVEMRNDKAKMYAAGAITLGGPYAAVDSFLGLQYAALCSVESLAAVRAPSLQRLNPARSFQQWLKWVWNQSP
jgi:pSer/pThr/pTyr-binding forkhead associated (FHA) protein